MPRHLHLDGPVLADAAERQPRYPIKKGVVRRPGVTQNGCHSVARQCGQLSRESGQDGPIVTAHALSGLRRGLMRQAGSSASLLAGGETSLGQKTEDGQRLSRQSSHVANPALT